MRVLAAVFASLLALPFANLATAQSSTPWISDPSSDLATMGLPIPSPSQWDGLDLVGLDIIEESAQIVFIVHVRDLQADDGTLGLGAGRIDLMFRNGDNAYTVWLMEKVGGADMDGRLNVRSGTDTATSAVARLPVVADVASDSISVAIDRGLLIDGNGTPPTRGTVFTELWVESKALVPGALTAMATAQLTINDRMPDGQAFARDWASALGPEQLGEMRLHSRQPFRASNGEAGSFLYNVTLANTGSSSQSFRLEVGGVPPGWEVVLPQPFVNLDGGAQHLVPVVAIVPFTHQHATFASFTLSATAIGDESTRGSLELGIHYLQVPQPSGHHDTLFVHSRAYEMLAKTANPLLGGSDGELYMNGLADDVGDDMAAVVGSMTFGVMPTYHWYVHLEPGLLLGLDADVNGKAVLDLILESGEPGRKCVPGGQLVLLGPAGGQAPSRFPSYNGRNQTVLASVDESEPLNWASAGQQRTELLLTFTPEADLVPFVAGRSLVLELECALEGAQPVLPAVRLVPGTTLSMPLTDYHDPLASSFASRSIHLEPLSTGAQPFANPGETVALHVDMRNLLATAQEAHLELLGPAAKLSTLVDGEHRHLAAGETDRIVVHVKVPLGAADGERFEVVLKATDGAGSSAIAVLLAIADVDADHPDATPNGTDKDAPNGGTLFVLLALVVGVFLRRRNS